MGRGPSYPYVDLEQAVALTRKLYDFAKKAPAPMSSVIKEAWEYSPTSSSGEKVIAALKAFDLIEESVSGENKFVKITDAAYRILVDEPNSAERRKVLQEAVLSPKWYKYCWDTWGEEMPPSMRSNLLFEHGFVESTVDKFVQDYKKSVAYAGLAGKSNPTKEAPQSNPEKQLPFNIGDVVQWESQGVLKLPGPKRITGFYEDGKYAVLEGSSTGVPVDQLIPAEIPVDPLKKTDPPRLEKGRERVESTLRQDVFSLDEGDVTIAWPASLSQASYDDITDWLEILKRKIGRSVKPPDTTE